MPPALNYFVGEAPILNSMYSLSNWQRSTPYWLKLSVQVNWELGSVLSSTGPSPYTGPGPLSGPPSILDGAFDPIPVLSSVLSTAPF